MFQLRKITTLIITFLFLGQACADDNSQASKTSQLQKFKTSQKCYANSVANENWKLGLECAKSSLDTGRELFNAGHKNIAALTHNYALMLANNNKHVKANDEYEKVYKLYKKLYGKTSETIGWLLLDTANSQVNYNPQKASKNYLKALDILSTQKLIEPLIEAEISLEASIHLTGSQELTKRTLNRALTLSEFAYKTYLNTYDARHAQTALAAFTIGKISFLKGDDAIAKKFLNQSLVNPDIAIYTHGLLVDIHTKNGRFDLAQKHQKALGKVSPKRGQESEYIPVFVQSPKYPKRAMQKRIQGYAIVSLTITKDGSVKDTHIVEEHPKKWGFGKAALKVAKKLKYAPQIEDGMAIEIPMVMYKYTFRMP
jgi:TonB family protein